MLAHRAAWPVANPNLGVPTVGLELGCDGVLMNTAIAGAKDPVAMATAMKLAVEAGRLAFKAGRIGKKLYATASSPLEGVPEWTS